MSCMRVNLGAVSAPVVLCFALSVWAASPDEVSVRAAGDGLRFSMDAAKRSNRVVKYFDFDEVPLGNLESKPMYWEKITGPGFPPYVNGELDETVGTPPPCFRLQLDGANLAYRFTELRIPAHPGSDHKVQASVRMDNATYSRGYVEAFYMDRFGTILESTRHRSRLVGPPRPPANPTAWQQIEIELPYTDARGRFIGMTVNLMQSDRLPDDTSHTARSYRKDIRATMYIDDLVVLRLPTCRLRLMKDRALYDAGEEVIVQAVVADPVPDDLTARLTVTDLASGKTTTMKHPVLTLPSLSAILHGDADSPLLTKHVLGKLPVGSYRIVLDVLSARETIITRQCQVAVVEPVQSQYGRAVGQFGVDLSATSPRNLVELTKYVESLGAAWALVPLWRDDMKVMEFALGQTVGDKMAIHLNRAGVSVLGNFRSTPSDLAPKTRLFSPSIWDMFAQKPEVWSTELSLVLSRHADRIDHWVFGQVNDCWQMPYPDMPRVFKNLQTEISHFQGQYSLVPAWPSMVDPKQYPDVDAYVTWLPDELLAQSYEDYYRIWSQRRERVWVVLPLPDLQHFELQRELQEFCSRVITSKRLGFNQLAVPALWQEKPTPEGPVLEPIVEYPIYANLVRQLAGMDYVGDVQLSETVSAMLFGGTNRATLVLLNQPGDELISDVTLGDELTASDMWGRPIPVTQSGESWRIKLSPIIFIQGVDGDLARFVASVRFNPMVLQSRLGWHQAELVFSNPFSQGISGQARVSLGQNWKFDPPGGRFATSGSRPFAIPIKIRFPGNEPVGRKMVSVRFTIEAKRMMKLNLLVPLELTLGDLDMRVLWFLRGGKLIVQQEIVNTGATSADLYAYLVAPNRPRMERVIQQLGPGQRSIKEYNLGSWQTLFGQSIRVGFRDVRGDRIVNKLITLQ